MVHRTEEYTRDHAGQHSTGRTGHRPRSEVDGDRGRAAAPAGGAQAILPAGGGHAPDPHGRDDAGPADSASPEAGGSVVGRGRLKQADVVANGAPQPPVAVLVDSNVWVRHFRSPDPLVEALLVRMLVRGHPDVIGELAMGRDPEASLCRDAVLELPSVDPVDRATLCGLVARYGMNGQGIGWVDAGLIAACLQSDDPMAIYTNDRAMIQVARAVGVSTIDTSPPR